MNLDLFQLKALPFRLSADPAFLYPSAQHAAALEQFDAALRHPDGIVLLTGDTGTGKTTVVERFLTGLPPACAVARLNQTQVTASGFLQGLLVQFGLTPFDTSRAEMLAAIGAFLADQQAAGHQALLVVDEAQNLGAEVLEEIGELARLRGADDRQPLCIVLAGQTPLAALLDTPPLAAVAAEVHVRLQLAALPAADVAAYVQHRLDVAGAGGRIMFDEPALELVVRYTGGMPRLINTLCDTALTNAYERHLEHAGAAEVQAAIDSLQWVEYAARSTARRRPPPRLPPPAVLAALAAPSLAQPDRPASPPDAPVGYLQVSLDGRVVAALELRRGRLLIGRTSDNDLQIDSSYVSRHHCQISVAPGAVVITDLNSTNGLHVRGERVRRHVLAAGDVVTIGQHALTYQTVPPTGAGP